MWWSGAGLLLAAERNSEGGPPWAVLIPAAVTLIGIALMYLRPTKDAEARNKSQAALDATAINQMQLDNALAMQKAEAERADRLEERYGLQSARLDEVLERMRACEETCARLRVELAQHKAEAEGLAEIVDDRLLNGGDDAATADPSPR